MGSYIEPQRSILGDISNCDCTRTIFNISIAPTFGTIQNSLFFKCIISPITLLGIILTMNYYKRKRPLIHEFSSENHNKKQVVRYSIMLLALAGGIVHSVGFPRTRISSCLLQYLPFSCCRGPGCLWCIVFSYHVSKSVL